MQGSNAYATIKDLEARFRELKDGEKARAQVLLNDAATKLRFEFKNYGVKLEPDADTLEALKLVSCAMVKRVLASPGFEDAVGADISEFRTEAGPFSETYGFNNPDGTMYIKKEERKLLGLNSRGRINTIPLFGDCCCKKCGA